MNLKSFSIKRKLDASTIAEDGRRRARGSVFRSFSLRPNFISHSIEPADLMSRRSYWVYTARRDGF